jgi:cyclase
MENKTCCLDGKVSAFRIFARLDVKNLNVVKGIQLDGLRSVGDPIELARKYLEAGVDELVLVDVVASLYNRKNLSSLITEIADELRIPLTGLGGVKNLSDARSVFNSGADKVALNSAGLESPGLFMEISELYGSQSVVCSVEAKKINKASLWNCMTENGRNDSGTEITEWIPKLESLGVGEVFVTSVDRDGTSRGPDLELCERIRNLTEIPVIYSGGIRDAEDIYQIADIGIDGVAIGAALHYGKLSISESKEILFSKGIFVRTLEGI